MMVWLVDVPKRTLGGNIKALRLARKLAQGALAVAADAHPSTMNRWENDEATPEIAGLLKLAVALETTIERLVDGIDPNYAAWLASRAPCEEVTTLWQQLDAEAAAHALAMLRLLAKLPPPGTAQP